MKSSIAYLQDKQRKITQLVTQKFKKYYLTGGTALAFYLGHRVSEDLDFFTQGYRKENPDQIMKFVSETTGFNFKLVSEQEDPKLIPMKVYFLELGGGVVLKIDFVQDFQENIQPIKNGLHSVVDIYFRKMMIAIGTSAKESAVGKMIPTGRHSAKDLFDLYSLSKHHRPASGFFLEYFSLDKVERLIAWYRSFNRMKLKMELLDLVEGVDTAGVLKHLDEEILKKLPDKLSK